MRLTVPRPISVNNMFMNAGKRRVITRKYQEWRQQCEAAILAQSPKPISGPVRIRIQLADTGRSIDTDNCAKGYLDVLVRLGLIPDDSRKFIRSLLIEWDGDPLNVITVEEA